MLVGVGLLIALRYARRELNSRAYIIATIVCLSAAVGFASVGIENALIHGSQQLIPQILIVTYLIRALIDYGLLAVDKNVGLSSSYLKMANEVSGILKNKRSRVPSIHSPTNPLRACFYAIVFVVSLLGLYAFQFLLAQVSSEQPSLIGALAPFFGPIGFIYLAAIAALARRHYVLRADRALELDNRTPVLFLRSFMDDSVRLWGTGVYGKFRRKTIDESVRQRAERVGPFVAIANPRTSLPRLGAAQAYFSNDTWQTAISRWVQMAEMIIMVAGRTDGIRWELDHIFSNEGHAKLVIFLPPALRKDPATAARWFRECFSRTPYEQEILAIDPTKTIAIAFLADGLFVIETKRIRKRQVDYITAMQAIVFGRSGKLAPSAPMH